MCELAACELSKEANFVPDFSVGLCLKSALRPPNESFQRGKMKIYKTKNTLHVRPKYLRVKAVSYCTCPPALGTMPI